jgi:hypothetical protein
MNLNLNEQFQQAQAYTRVNAPMKMGSTILGDIGEEVDPAHKFTGQYDYVMVFPINKDTGEQSNETKFCIHEILDAGLEIFPYKSIQEDELYVLIRCPVSFTSTAVIFSDNYPHIVY